MPGGNPQSRSAIHIGLKVTARCRAPRFGGSACRPRAEPGGPAGPDRHQPDRRVRAQPARRPAHAGPAQRGDREPGLPVGRRQSRPVRTARLRRDQGRRGGANPGTGPPVGQARRAGERPRAVVLPQRHHRLADRSRSGRLDIRERTAWGAHRGPRNSTGHSSSWLQTPPATLPGRPCTWTAAGPAAERPKQAPDRPAGTPSGAMRIATRPASPVARWPASPRASRPAAPWD